MSLTKEETKELRRVYRGIRSLPAFEGVVFRRCNLKGLYGMAKITEDGSRVVYISSEIGFTDALHTLAHECAHLLVDMDNTHNEVFSIMCTAMEKVIRMLIYV